MKKAMLAVLFLSFAGAIAAVPAFGQTVDYTNATAYSGTGVAYGIYDTFYTSDSFTLVSSATVTSVSFDYWVSAGYVPTTSNALTSVNWSIGTSALGGSLGSAAAVAPASWSYIDTVNDNHGQAGFYYQVYSESISIPNIDLGPGTYWLTLSSALNSSGPSYGYWEVSDGPSAAYNPSYGTIPSETFEILGTGGPVSTPEGGSSLLYLAMAGTLCLGCIVAVKRSRLSQLSPESYADSQ